jgi:hypothetical protein
MILNIIFKNIILKLKKILTKNYLKINYFLHNWQFGVYMKQLFISYSNCYPFSLEILFPLNYKCMKNIKVKIILNLFNN